jgi:hypothetical protein
MGNEQQQSPFAFPFPMFPAPAPPQAQAPMSPAWDPDGPLLDTGGVGGVQTGQLIDFVSMMAEGTRAAPLFNVLGAANTYLNHDPATTGALGHVERGAVTAVDTLLGMHPLGAVDQAFGGHGSGVFTGGTEAYTSLFGGYGAMSEASQHMRDGKHGAITQGIANVGHFIGDGIGKLVYDQPKVYERAPRNPEEQRTHDMLMRGRKSGSVVYYDE